MESRGVGLEVTQPVFVLDNGGAQVHGAGIDQDHVYVGGFFPCQEFHPGRVSL